MIKNDHQNDSFHTISLIILLVLLVPKLKNA